MKIRKTLFPVGLLPLLCRTIGIQDSAPGPAPWTKFFLRHELLWSEVLREPAQIATMSLISQSVYTQSTTNHISLSRRSWSLQGYLEVDPGQNLLPRWHSHSCWFYASLFPLWFLSVLTILLLMLYNVRVSIWELLKSYHRFSNAG